MITNEELQISNISYINKDFQTIYPELVELIKKLTNIVDPTATNESDPFIVLLKMLAFMGDKLNYNVDKQVLETKVPSATQISNVRTILENNGYTMQYYNSAKTYITMVYRGDIPSNNPIEFKAFDTKFTDVDNTLVYTLLKDLTLTATDISVGGIEYPIAQGEPKYVYGLNKNETLQLSDLDDNNRLFFPEKMVASNCIYVKYQDSQDWFTEWKVVENLNIQQLNTPCFKFGYDSEKDLPFIQFPSDISELIKNGINVRYIKTLGASGNVPAKKLVQLYEPSLSNLTYSDGETQVPETDELTGANLLELANPIAATNGCDPEDIDTAYNNYKKIVGTFDTLITCRDFANYLYNLLNTNNYPYVSNIQVTDRRSDINYVLPFVSYGEYGQFLQYKVVDDTYKNITPFDLVLYPLRFIDDVNTVNAYQNTFKPLVNTDNESLSQMISSLDEVQSIDHTFLSPVVDEQPVYLYKNYYKLNAQIVTKTKVNYIEQLEIINNVKLALMTTFKARNIDYGVEIPYDSIYQCILNADPRIKTLSLSEPEINTLKMDYQGTETSIFGVGINEYYKLIIRNILAGKIPLFNYDTNFDYRFGLTDVTQYNEVTSITPKLVLNVLPNFTNTLLENQAVQLFSTNYSTQLTLTVGVNFKFVSTITTLVQKNEVYKLTPNDELYWSNTDSNGNTFVYKYSYNKIEKMLTNGYVVSTQNVNANIISPDFDMYEINHYGSNRTSASITVGDMGEFDQLAASENINMLQPVQVTFDKNNLYAYWFVNNSSNDLFNNNVRYDEVELTSDTYVPNKYYTESGGVYSLATGAFDSSETYYEKKLWTILNENEYFFYTDASHSRLELFGGGTYLETNITTDDYWKLDKDDLISIELFEEYSLSTFNAINWKVISFSGGTYFQAKEQNILTLTENDSFNYTGRITLDNTLQDLNLYGQSFYYTLDGENTTAQLRDVAGEKWKIRTRLDINCGPNLPQKLKTNESIEIKYGLPTSTSQTISSNYIELNTLTQMSGNGTIDFTYKDILGNLVTDVNLINYDIENVIDSAGNVITPNYLGQYIFDVADKVSGTYLTLPTPNRDVVFLVYWNKTNNSSGAVSVSTPTDDGDVYVQNTSTYLGSTISKNINLQAGVNVIVAHDCDEVKINITATMGSTDTMLVEQLKVYDGLNSSINATDENAFMSLIKDVLDGEDQFNYCCNITNSNLIESDDYRDARTLFNKNNIANKQTLAEIDFGNSSIIIVKSSQL